MMSARWSALALRLPKREDQTQAGLPRKSADGKRIRMFIRLIWVAKNTNDALHRLGQLVREDAFSLVVYFLKISITLNLYSCFPK